MVVAYIQQGHTLRLCFFFSSGFNKVKGRTFESRRLKSIVLYRYKLPISTRTIHNLLYRYHLNGLSRRMIREYARLMSCQELNTEK